jgi:predicted nucleotidyltransferase
VAAIALLANEQAALDDFRRALREALGDRVLELRLYGSKARGDWTEESDLDVAVVVDRMEPGLRRRIVFMAAASGLPRDVDLSVKVFDRATYERMAREGWAFAQAVAREGIDLWTTP